MHAFPLPLVDADTKTCVFADMADMADKPMSATGHGNLCLRRHGRQTYVCTDLFAVLETIEYKKMAKSMQGMMGEKSLDLTVDSC